MTSKEALATLIDRIENAIWAPDLVANIEVLHTDLTWKAYNGSLDAAKALHDAVLPGWGWRIGACFVSDDATVFPDFNCPVHGERLRATLDEGRDWFGDLDIDWRPPGNPARAWLLAILKALHAMEPEA